MAEDKQFRWSQSIPEDWIPYLDQAAEKAGKTRVGYVRDLIRESLPAKYQSKLSVPIAVGRPKKDDEK